MNVLMIGNGFDLFYSLPTTYINFIHIIQFLSAHNPKSFKSIGDIFNSPKLNDKHVKQCFLKNQDVCNQTLINPVEIQTLVDKANKNMWYQYFSQSITENITWIDFEQEIGTVIRVISEFVKEDTAFDTRHGNTVLFRIANSFHFLFEQVDQHTYRIKSEYIKKDSIDKTLLTVDRSQIASTLYSELSQFSEILQKYLELFAESIVISLIYDRRVSQWPNRLAPDYVVTFNYTTTFEQLFENYTVEHVHGKIGNPIVLGVSSDGGDETNIPDTTFIEFKKYYQRIVYQTDFGFLKFIKRFNPETPSLSLVVMGHSLDYTDRDYIKELFIRSKKITVLYHSCQARLSYIKNIVSIFGEDGLYNLRNKNGLEFRSIEKEGEIDVFCKENGRSNSRAWMY